MTLDEYREAVRRLDWRATYQMLYQDNYVEDFAHMTELDYSDGGAFDIDPTVKITQQGEDEFLLELDTGARYGLLTVRELVAILQEELTDEDY